MHYISEFIQAATKETYLSMISLAVEAIDGDEAAILPVNPDGVTVSVGFTGSFQGFVHMTYEEGLARNITFTMMGEMPAKATATEVGDVLTEMANMIGGSFKAKLAGKGLVCQASNPTFMPNSAFTPSSIPGGLALTNRLKLPVANGELEIRIYAKV